MAIQTKKDGLKVKEQLYFPVKFKGENPGRQFFDFLVEDQVVVELKKNNNFSKGNIDQVKQYLISSKLQLALLIIFPLPELFLRELLIHMNLRRPDSYIRAIRIRR